MSEHQIQITQVPQGTWSREAKEAWVGLILPCDPLIVMHGGRWNYQVPQGRAISIVTGKLPAIGKYWISHGFPFRDGVFLFQVDVARIVTGVFTRQEIVQVPEEAQGCPLR